MASDVTGPARDELEMPAAVRHLVEIGRLQLAAIREEERAAKVRQDEERAARRAAVFAPIMEAVLGVVPDTLSKYVAWRDDEVNPDAPPVTHYVVLNVPGCLPFDLVFTLLGDGSWGLHNGFPGHHTPSAFHPVPTLAVALAMARDVWVRQQDGDDDFVPF